MNVSHCARTRTPPYRANDGSESSRKRRPAMLPAARPPSRLPSDHNTAVTIAAATRSAAGTTASPGHTYRNPA
ncbi:MAG: hypothetical protein DMF84_02360 [Acidobacteria bacterium]|nr:MAG: hypothetical protein DMF84_02360 [Acidobacteriota bacterium]